MAFWVSLSVSVPDGGSVDKSDSDGNYKQGMNEVTLAVAAKVSFCSGILRFLTPGLTEMDIADSASAEYCSTFHCLSVCVCVCHRRDISTI